jgi:hypothetical protein
MRKVTLGAIAILFAITSCQKEDIINQDDTAAADVSTFLKMATSAAAVSTCKHADSADSLHRQKKHHIIITEIDIATLSNTISSYISTNYAGAVINKAGVDSLGNFYVKIMKADSSYIGLLFDANGVFIKELIRGNKRDRGTVIAVSALPASVPTYITANYATATIHKAILESDGTYKVILIQADGSYLGLAFDATGNFVSTITVKDKNGKKKRHH